MQSYTGVGKTRIKTIEWAEGTSVDTSCLELPGSKARTGQGCYYWEVHWKIANKENRVSQ